MSQLRTSRPNFPQQQRWPKVRKRSVNVLNVTNYVSVKFDRLCSPKSKKLPRAPLYRSKQCEQRLTLSVVSIWTQTLTTGMK